MAKRTDRTRRVKQTLETSAARPVEERVALAAGVRNVSVPQPGLLAPMPTNSSTYGGSSTPDATGQVGTPGNLNVFGYLTGEDYNQDLDGFQMFPNYNKMRLSDAQVNATLLMLKLPLKGATWTVMPASEDPQDVAIAHFAQARLIDDDALARSWQHVLDNAMLKFDFGCSAEEIVWDLATGDASLAERKTQHLIHLARTGKKTALEDVALDEGPIYARVKDLAPRLPRTFYRWVEDPKTNTLKFLQQFAPKNGQYGYYNIAAERLVLHVRNREGNAYYGRSVLRAAYPHWWWKQQLYRIDMIGHDRFHVGIPKASLTADYNANTAPIDKIETTLKGLRSHDRAYMIEPYGVTYDVFSKNTSTSSTSGIVQSIEHHNLMIARNILQSFAAQGEQRHGSFGAAKVTSDVYFDALQGEASEIASEIKQAVLKRLCDLNFNMDGRKYPTLVCADISAIDFNQLADSLQKLALAKIITPEDTLEAWLRDITDAPPLPEELQGQDRTTPPTAGQAAAAAPAAAAPKKTPAKGPGTEEKVAAAKFVERNRAFGRRPTALERRIMDVHGIPERLDTMTADLVRRMTAIRRQQLSAVAHRIAQKDSRKTAPFTDIRHAHVSMPHTVEMQKALRAAQTDALNYGRTSVHEELKRQGVTLPKRAELSVSLAAAGDSKSSATSALVSSAQITVRKQAENWKARILDEGLRLRRTGVQGDDLAQRIIDGLDDEAESGAKRDAAQELHEAFGIGRDGAARELGDSIDHAIYSAILDSNTCETCSDLDGEEFTVDSAEYDQNLPPNANCDGRDSCRCVYLYVAAEPEA